MGCPPVAVPLLHAICLRTPCTLFSVARDNRTQGLLFLALPLSCVHSNWALVCSSQRTLPAHALLHSLPWLGLVQLKILALLPAEVICDEHGVDSTGSYQVSKFPIILLSPDGLKE